MAEETPAPNPNELLFSALRPNKRPLFSYWLMLGAFASFCLISVWILMFQVKNGGAFGVLGYAVAATVAISLVIGVNHHINFFGDFKYYAGSLSVSADAVELGYWRYNKPFEMIVVPINETETALHFSSWGVTTLQIASKETRVLYEISEDDFWTDETLERAYLAIQRAREYDLHTNEPLPETKPSALPETE